MVNNYYLLCYMYRILSFYNFLKNLTIYINMKMVFTMIIDWYHMKHTFLQMHYLYSI